MADIFTREYLDYEYNVKMRSISDIAQEHGTYTNKVRRKLIKYNFTIRDKSETQSAAIAVGRAEHPTKGKKRSETVKAKIGKGVADNWKGLSKEEYEKRSQYAKDNWKNIPESQKEEMRRNSVKGIKEASMFGSKMEKFLAAELRKSNILVERHKKIDYTDKHIDLYLPKDNIAIEVDGVFHFKKIWDNDYLEKKQNMDNEKNGLLTSLGMVVIRIRVQSKSLSKNFFHEVFIKLVDLIKTIGQKPSLPIEDRVIYLDV